MAKNAPIFLDDLAIGDEYRSATHQLDAEQIVDFALQFDPQPFHLDDGLAKDTLFKGHAASGWHTAAITVRLLVDSLPLSNGLIGAGAEVEWPQPTRPGDTLHVISTITDIVPSRSKPDRGIVTVECRTLNQRKETCQRLVTKLVVMRKPS